MNTVLQPQPAARKSLRAPANAQQRERGEGVRLCRSAPDEVHSQKGALWFEVRGQWRALYVRTGRGAAIPVLPMPHRAPQNVAPRMGPCGLSRVWRWLAGRQHMQATRGEEKLVKSRKTAPGAFRKKGL